MVENKQLDLEAMVVEEMAKAQAISDRLFGSGNTVFAVHKVFDMLHEYNIPEEEIADDLKRTIDNAKIAHGVESPTPEQVFGLFERCFDMTKE